jgi:hypothetical protein
MQTKIHYSVLTVMCSQCQPACKTPIYEAETLLVYKESLAELLQRCSTCGEFCQLTWKSRGTCVTVVRCCEFCNAAFTWTSQPLMGSIPAGNICLSAAVYFGGLSYTKVTRMLSTLHCQTISQTTYYRHVQDYLQPTILSLWNSTQSDLIDHLISRPGEVVLGGDMRADSPGHCAKFGSYTLMELRANRVLHISLVQVCTAVYNQSH